MGMLGWVMMGLAIWHFTIFLPDRFWGGIVGAFVGSLVGAVDRRADHLRRQSLRAARSPAKRRPTSRSCCTRSPARCSASRSSTSRACAANAPAARRHPTSLVEPTHAAGPPAVPSRAGRSLAGGAAAAASRSPTARPRPSRALRRELGVSGALAQVLVRRGLAEPAARARVPGGRRGAPPARVRRHRARPSSWSSRHVRARRARSRSTATTTSTASARRRCSCARCARSAPTSTATCPTAPATATASTAATVQAPGGARHAAADHRRLRDHGGRGGRAGARARAWRWSSPTTTRRARTACCRDAPIVHPALCGYPCAELCATAVAYKLAQALYAGARARRERELRARPRPGGARDDRRRRAAAWARTARSCARGLRALAAHRQARAARADGGRAGRPGEGRTSARSAFALAPRLNAAGRLYRADAGLELILTEDPLRAAQIAAGARPRQPRAPRRSSTRIRFEAEAQIASWASAPPTCSPARAGTRA